MARLSAEKWLEIRNLWERAPDPSYKWIAEQFGIARETVRPHALREGWTKNKHSSVISQVPAPGIKKRSNRSAVARSKKKIEPPEPSQIKPKKKGNGKHYDFPVDPPTGKRRACLSAKTVLAEGRKELFCRAYMETWSPMAAAIAAGYSKREAASAGYAVLRDPEIQLRLRELFAERARTIGMNGDDLMKLWAAIIDFDMNEIVELRRTCCPYCYSPDPHQKLLKPSELEDAEKDWTTRRVALVVVSLVYLGGFKYTKRTGDTSLPPVKECPECHGEGTATVFYHDTRYMGALAKKMYCGVKKSQSGGYDVLTLDKETAFTNLARALGVFKDRETPKELAIITPEQLDALYASRMREAREKQERAYAARGIVDVEPIEEVYESDQTDYSAVRTDAEAPKSAAKKKGGTK